MRSRCFWRAFAAALSAQGQSVACPTPGKETTVEIALDAEAFQYWNEHPHTWTIVSGEY